MKAYNGFSGDLRNQAQRWLNAQMASGRLTRPTLCHACGQDKGVFDMHAEDYSLPFSLEKTAEFHLCYACHMAVHCRFRCPRCWDQYRERVRDGCRPAPFFTRSFSQFIGLYYSEETLFSDSRWWDTGVKPARLVLDVIDSWELEHRGRGWR